MFIFRLLLSSKSPWINCRRYNEKSIRLSLNAEVRKQAGSRSDKVERVYEAPRGRCERTTRDNERFAREVANKSFIFTCRPIGHSITLPYSARDIVRVSISRVRVHASTRVSRESATVKVSLSRKQIDRFYRSRGLPRGKTARSPTAGGKVNQTNDVTASRKNLRRVIYRPRASVARLTLTTLSRLPQRYRGK